MRIADNAVLSGLVRIEFAGGVALMLSTIIAIMLANSPISGFYSAIFDTPVEVRIGAFQIAKPLLLWINDGLMAIFFLVVGLELKRELFEGELSDRHNLWLPGAGAFGGMLVPALIFFALNQQDDVALKGWAIPAATDIAFALGVLYLLGSRVPSAIKVFLTSLAIFDDIGAIIIIAVFYTEHFSVVAGLVVLSCLGGLMLLNRLEVKSNSLYVLVGVVMWAAMLKSGVHATLTGVLLAMFIPIKIRSKPRFSPLKTLEHDLHPVVAFVILPVFALANAGIDFSGISIADLFHRVTLGVGLGLFIGKLLGVVFFCWLCVALKFTQLPRRVNWPILVGTAALCGIGFTMSLFIGSLAYGGFSVEYLHYERLGILSGSLCSGLLGFYLLHRFLPPPRANMVK